MSLPSLLAMGPLVCLLSISVTDWCCCLFHYSKRLAGRCWSLRRSLVHTDHLVVSSECLFKKKGANKLKYGMEEARHGGTTDQTPMSITVLASQYHKKLLSCMLQQVLCRKASRRDLEFHSMHVHPKTAVLHVRSVLRHPQTPTGCIFRAQHGFGQTALIIYSFGPKTHYTILYRP